MFLGTFKNSIGTQVFEIKNNISKLLVMAKFKAYSQANLGGASGRQCTHMAHILLNVALNGNVTVTRYSNTGQGTKHLITNTPFRDIVELSALNEGTIRVWQADDNDPTDDDYIAIFSVDLCNSGAISCDKDNFLRIELNGFSPYNYNADIINQDVEYTFYTAGSFQRINEHVKYAKVACQAGQPVEFDVADAYAVAVPYDLDRLVLHSVKNETQEITGPELEMIANDLSDEVLNFAGLKLDYFKYRLIPVSMIVKGSVQMLNASNFYILTNKNYEDKAPADPKSPAIEITPGVTGKISPIVV